MWQCFLVSKKKNLRNYNFQTIRLQNDSRIDTKDFVADMSEWVGGQISLLFLGLRIRVAQDPGKHYRSQVLRYPSPAKRLTDVSIR